MTERATSGQASSEQVAVPGRVRAMQDTDLEQVLAWRNHPDVRRFMYTQHEISIDEHRAWFAAASQNPQCDLLVYEVECEARPEKAYEALGFAQLKIHADKQIADWGFYLAPQAPKGTGRQLGAAALNFAFHVRKLHKVCGEALGFNDKSIRFHLALGFRQEGLLREQHVDGKQYHDVVCFGLLANEWCE